MKISEILLINFEFLGELISMLKNNPVKDWWMNTVGVVINLLFNDCKNTGYVDSFNIANIIKRLDHYRKNWYNFQNKNWREMSSIQYVHLARTHINMIEWLLIANHHYS
jgi:hypothetical protein